MDLIRKALAIIAIIPVPAAPLLAQPAYLVADVNQVEIDGSSAPDRFVTVGGVVYFTAYDDLHGRELWRTDGTESGTWRVRDLCPGRCSSSPAAMTAVGDRLYFLATSGTAGPETASVTRGAELWKTDGTFAGTELVRRVCSRRCASGNREMVAVGGFLFFQGTDEDHGGELWSSDGTFAGTGLVRDIRPGPEGSILGDLESFAGRVFFRADDGVHGSELWRSDGTAGGTELIADLCPDSCFTSRLDHIRHLLPDALTFVADDGVHSEELWVSDGTAAGTARVSDVPGNFVTLNELVRFGDLIYFLAGGGDPPAWKSDGTAAGTVPAPELLPLGSGHRPLQLRAAGERLFFTLKPSSQRTQVWATDGLAGGTVLLADLNSPVTLGSALDGRLAFAVYADPTYREGSLWISDGTPNGTEEIYAVTPDRKNFLRQIVAVRDGVMYLGADDGSAGFELWRTDGSADGTALVRQVQPAMASSYPRHMAAFDRRLFFTANEGVFDGWRRLWSSDGTAAGTEVAESRLAVFSDPVAAGGRLFFRGRILDFSGRTTLWATDGARDAAVPVADSAAGRELTAVGDLLYFLDSDSGQQIWRSDGSPAGTFLIKDVHPGWFACPFPCAPEVIPPAQLTASGSLAFFVAHEDHIPQLWRSDGSEPGTLALAGFADYPRELTGLDGTLVFSAFEPGSGQELWVSDGTQKGTGLLADLSPGAASSDPRQLTRVGDRVYFLITGDDHRDRLWATDGSAAGTVLVGELQLDASGSRGGLLAAAGKRLFLTVEHETTGEELWVSDGSAAGTHLVADVLPGPIGSRPRALTAVGAGLLFAADDGVRGQEVWFSDGTAAGTRRLADVVPGIDASDPADFTVAGERVFFAAVDAELGRELFAFDAAEVGICLGQICPGPGPGIDERRARIVKVGD